MIPGQPPLEFPVRIHSLDATTSTQNLGNLDATYKGDRPMDPTRYGRSTAWSKNLTDKKYNAEFSTGGFLWRALPRRYGVDFTFKF
jgi:hypothetical protein